MPFISSAMSRMFSAYASSCPVVSAQRRPVHQLESRYGLPVRMHGLLFRGDWLLVVTGLPLQSADHYSVEFVYLIGWRAVVLWYFGKLVVGNTRL